jgi:hypothetical protein
MSTHPRIKRRRHAERALRAFALVVAVAAASNVGTLHHRNSGMQLVSANGPIDDWGGPGG